MRPLLSPVGASTLGGLWRYRSFILGMVKREFQARYLGSVLGAAWAFAQPLTMIFVYTVVFGQIMRARVPGVVDGLGYGVFVCAGVLPWNLLAEVMQRCVGIFVEQANLLKKMSFPRSSLPTIAVLSAGINFAIVFGLLLMVLALGGRFPGFALFAMIPLLAIQLALTVGIGVALGVVNVFFRDVSHAIGVLLQLWFWFTPILYPVRILPAGLRPWVALNPMTAIVGGYQDILLRGAWPDWSGLAGHAILALLVLWLGWLAFRRLSAEMVDYL